MPRHNPSLVGAKLSHQSARTPRSQASKPTPRQARRPAPEPSNRRARRNKFVTFYRGWHLRGGFQLRLRHPARKIFTCAETDTIEPARIEESSLSNVRSEHAGGLFVPLVGPGDCVVRGQALAEVRNTFGGNVRDTLISPIDGRVFFSRSAPLVNQYSIAFKIAPQ